MYRELVMRSLLKNRFANLQKGFVKRVEAKGVDMQSLSNMLGSQNHSAAQRFVLYYTFKAGEEFYYKELESIMKLHYPAAIEGTANASRLQAFISRETRDGGLLKLCRQQDGGYGNRKFQLVNTNLEDLRCFARENFDINLLVSRHPLLVRNVSAPAEAPTPKHTTVKEVVNMLREEAKEKEKTNLESIREVARNLCKSLDMYEDRSAQYESLVKKMPFLASINEEQAQKLNALWLIIK